ncbi:MAG TPA: hypothetical protein PLK94_14865, partial [Alphaproteobacteria bacterium]|nr:hypothetical protein [Alphaproteobacteria bacterium]
YGIHVAQLAGLPEEVIARAEQVLELLENNKAKTANLQLPLFHVPVPSPRKAKTSKIEERLAEINPDSLSPKEALDLMYQLKTLQAD